MATHPFKVGDRVRVVPVRQGESEDGEEEFFKIGDIGTVDMLMGDSEQVIVQFDPPHTNGKGWWHVSVHELELLGLPKTQNPIKQGSQRILDLE